MLMDKGVRNDMESDVQIFHQVSESKGWECTLIPGVFHNKHTTFLDGNVLFPLEDYFILTRGYFMSLILRKD